jgi:hypothetical protein
MMDEKKHGGKRIGSGRKVLTDEEKFIKAAERRKILVDELLFPAVATAFHADPGKWQDRYLEVELPKEQIELAYGKDGLVEWQSFFSIKKIGGRDRFGLGYKTRWVLNLNKYSFILKFIESLGYTAKNVPEAFFPPEVMLERLRLIEERRAKKKAAKEAKIDKEYADMVNNLIHQ